MTPPEFYSRIDDFGNKFPNRDLETYLLALLLLVRERRHSEPTAELLLELLQQAFTSEPAAFDPEWLQLTQMPDTNIMSRKFTNPEIAHTFNKRVVADTSGMEFTEQVLRFQISELHKMRGKQLDNPMRYFGITSETGNRWYNFDPMTNLECGARCLVDGADDETTELYVSWQTLGELLEMGRVYE